MILNYNGQLIPESEFHLNRSNRAFKYGDGLFDTLKSKGESLFFIEDHYFRLMASMRVLRMDIPMDFTLDFYKNAILNTLKANQISGEGRIRVTVYRKDGGYYLPENMGIEFMIEAYPWEYTPKKTFEIDLFKDFPVTTGFLGTLKTTQRLLNVVARIYADENNFDNCILLNSQKNVAEAINANIFVVKGDTIATPDLEEGCVKGIIRMKLIEILKKEHSFKLEERRISPFELLNADEVFLTNSLMGVQSVTKYRKRSYAVEVGNAVGELLAKHQL